MKESDKSRYYSQPIAGGAGLVLTGLSVIELISILDRTITGVFSIIRAIKTDDLEIQAKIDVLIGRMKTMPDFKAPDES